MDEILRYERCSHQDLIRSFEHQLCMKIRTDRTCLVTADFRERWVTVASRFAWNRLNLIFLFKSTKSQRKDFLLRPLAASRFGQWKPRNVSQIATKLYVTDTMVFGKPALETPHTWLQSTSLRGINLPNVSMRTSTDFFLTQFCIHIQFRVYV